MSSELITRSMGRPSGASGDQKRRRTENITPLEKETVRRDRPQDFEVSLQAAAVLTPDARLPWLTSALEQAKRGVARPSDIFDIISHTRFAAGVPDGTALRIMDELLQYLDLFPPSLTNAINDGEFDLARASARASQRSAAAASREREQQLNMQKSGESDMMARCVQFVQKNETALAKMHAIDARTYQVQLQRSSVQQPWGMAWSKAAFKAKRRVLEKVVQDSPAGFWNMQHKDGNEQLQPGDELMAVNGYHDWDGMACIKELLEATLTLKRLPPKPKSEEKCGPPLFSKGGYSEDASGSGWWGHTGGKWLYSKTDQVYFHLPKKELFIEDPSEPGTFILLPGTGGQSAPKVGPGSAEGANIVPDAASAAAAASGVEFIHDDSKPRMELHGRVRWFNDAKGFGFIQPWFEYPASPGSSSSSSTPPSSVPRETADGSPDAEVSQQHQGQRQGKDDGAKDDVFFHRRALIDEDADVQNIGATLLPGAPVRFGIGLQSDGKLCATDVESDAELNSLVSVGASLGPAARIAEKTAVGFKDALGREHSTTFVGVVTGRRGVEGAEFVALRLAKNLDSCLRGRDHGGERAARVALAAALRQTQTGFLDYARRLSENSASVWLAAETIASVAWLIGPEVDGRPRILLATVGGGQALVVRRDGSVAGRLLQNTTQVGSAASANDCALPAAISAAVGWRVRSGDNNSRAAVPAACVPTDNTAKMDPLKVFEKGLKGPAIQFPSIFSLHGGEKPQRGRGFGAHAWSERDGGAANLEFEIHSYALDWLEDVLLIVASDSIWERLRELGDSEVARVALSGLQNAPSNADASKFAADRLFEAAKHSIKTGSSNMDDGAVAVLRFDWCEDPPKELSCIAKDKKTVTRRKGDSKKTRMKILAQQPLIANDDDMFAAPPMELASPDRLVDESSVEEEEDELEQEKDEEEKEDKGEVNDAEPQKRTGALDVGPAHEGCATPPADAGNTEAHAEAQNDKLDDMFADFCKELSVI